MEMTDSVDRKEKMITGGRKGRERQNAGDQVDEEGERMIKGRGREKRGKEGRRETECRLPG